MWLADGGPGESGRKVSIDPIARRLVVAFATAAVCLIGINLIFFAGRYGLGRDLAVPRLLNLDEEWNVPTYLSALMLTTGTWVSMRIGQRRRRGRDKESMLWFVLAAGLYYFAIDEVVQIHERLTVPMRDLLGLSGVFYFGWVVPAIIVVAASLPICIRFVRQLDVAMRSLFVGAAVLYVGGALGVELVGGWLCQTRGAGDPSYVASAIVEESAEMAGIIVLLYALFAQLRSNVSGPVAARSS